MTPHWRWASNRKVTTFTLSDFGRTLQPAGGTGGGAVGSDLLAVFTDGMTECEDKNGEQFGEERLIELLIQNCERPLDEVSRIATERVLTWAHDPGNQDDTTLMLARRV